MHPHCGGTDHLRIRSALLARTKLEVCFEGGLSGCKLLCAHEDPVGVVSGKGEDTQSRFGQRVQNLGEDAGEREVDGPVYFECAPWAFIAVVVRDRVCGADDGDFGCGERDREKRRGCEIESGAWPQQNR